MVFQDQDIVIGNVGDSRAVLATRDEDNSLIALQLTVDLKPDLPGLSLSLSHAHTHLCRDALYLLFTCKPNIN
jgi:serine/threonine protein phosphatase PrpC